VENPYLNLPNNRFWRSAVVTSSSLALEEIFVPKWKIDRQMKIATAGSCFAQHITSTLRHHNFNVFDYERPPDNLSAAEYSNFGYKLFSCRYGNIYTSKQMLQLAQEALGVTSVNDDLNSIWINEGKFYDAFRPNILPGGFTTRQEVIDERQRHLMAVRQMLLETDLLVFTLGLTETWIDKVTLRTYPTAPGLIASPERESVSFHNFDYGDIYSDLVKLDALLSEHREKPIRFLLTVSPVPLTGTASGQHVLLANTYSKSTLRAVSGDLASKFKNFDYFPSFEIITNPAMKTSLYDKNLRTVTSTGISRVMDHFLDSYEIDLILNNLDQNEDAQCEDAILEKFAPSLTTTSIQNPNIYSFGDSHLASFLARYRTLRENEKRLKNENTIFIPVLWAEQDPFKLLEHNYFRDMRIKEGFDSRIARFEGEDTSSTKKVLCIVGLNFLGNSLINIHGRMKAGWTNPDGSYPSGSEISPVIPIVDSVQRAEAEIHKKWNFYLKQKRAFILELSEQNIWDEIYWVTSPMMCDKVARFRLGDKFVESGSQNYYNEAASQIYSDVFADPIANLSILTDTKTSEFGFTRDSFLPGPVPFDTHVSPEYFDNILTQIF
jgi:hypothetical protein